MQTYLAFLVGVAIDDLFAGAVVEDFDQKPGLRIQHEGCMISEEADACLGNAVVSDGRDSSPRIQRQCKDLNISPVGLRHGE